MKLSTFFKKIDLKSKYITCYFPKGLAYPSTNPAWQSLPSPNEQGIKELWECYKP